MHLWQAYLNHGGKLTYHSYSSSPRMNFTYVDSAIENPENGEEPGDDTNVTGWKLAVPGRLL